MYKTPTKKRPSQTTKYEGKCVCDICNCGAHRCPPQPRPADPNHFNTTTKYTLRHPTLRDAYQQWPINKTAPFTSKEPYKQSHYDPNNLKSSYKDDYTPKKTSPPEMKEYKPIQRNYRADYPDSEYKQNYKQ